MTQPERARELVRRGHELLGSRHSVSSEAASGSGLTGDEADWASSARAHAARNLALGGQPAAAAALLHTLDAEDRDDVEPMVAKSLQDLERLAAG